MNEEKLKAMWNKTESVASGSVYNSQLIHKYLSGRSNEISQKIRNIIRFDIILKALLVLALGVDLYLFAETKNIVSVVLLAIIVMIPLIIYERKMLARFNEAADLGQNTRDKLVLMLAYLKTKFTSTLLAVSTSYLFVFIAGSLIYYYLAYGYVRALDRIDILVFSGFILIGIAINFLVNKGQVKFQVRHLEHCLSDLNDQALPFAEELIETQRKQDRINKLLLGVILVAGFLLLIAVFMNIGKGMNG